MGDLRGSEKATKEEMKNNNVIGILLTISGVGLVAFLIYKLVKPSTTPAASPTANPQTASPFSALYNGFGKLFGGQPQTDNTGALITASGNALTGLASGVKSLFSTPVASPVVGPATVSPGLTVAPDPTVDSFDYSTLE